MNLHGKTDNSIMIVNILVNKQLRQGRFCSKSKGPLAGRCRERTKSLGRQLLANLAPIVIFTELGENARRLARKYRLSSLWWKNVENQLSRWWRASMARRLHRGFPYHRSEPVGDRGCGHG